MTRDVRVRRAVLGAAILLVACDPGGADDDAPPPRTHVVEIRAMEFHPADLRVLPGDTVVWINEDFVPHTATAADSAWTSPPLAQGERWTMVVPTDAPGPYVCAFHPVMGGRLTFDHPDP